MLDPKKINEFVQNIMESLPPGLKNLPADVEQNMKSALQSSFVKLDLVTREEFDAQVNVLRRTREKLEALEKKIKELESERELERVCRING